MPEANAERDAKAFAAPPVLPDVVKQLEEYVLCLDRLPIHNYEKSQQFWPRKPNPSSLYHYELSPLGSTLKVDRDFATGKVLQFREVLTQTLDCNARNSLSLSRAPQPYTGSIMGNATNFPFWPGGFPDLPDDDNIEQEDNINFEDDLLYIAPGFTKGIQFKADGRTPLTEEDMLAPKVPEMPEITEEPTQETESAVNLLDVIKQEDDLLGLWKETTNEAKYDEKDGETMIIQSMNINETEDLKVIPEKDTVPVLKISEAGPLKQLSVAKWAECINISLAVTDFHDQIPTMAHTFPFELDIFQQQAILKVEKHCNVFVAAHTSAGKTVVAEYAIALSKNNRTRTVYTSPIKALSNQKFRDFKKTFNDVGLITGDCSLNKEAGCLIMTTEILRSMLYQGSEVIRELEFVIFDEVHYINNEERGHVWEETLILLPKDVCIIMLSATVSNTLNFADWVGRTKQKKMYVISTEKRPVPLTHHLFVYIGPKNSKQILILEGEGEFRQGGYCEAKQTITAAKDRAKRFTDKLTPKEESNMWNSFIKHLQQQKLLPVIVFSLSRKRCDQYAEHYMCVDLIGEEEKEYIVKYFDKSIQHLKGADKILPQVLSMKSMLQKGIGVHHSGILPILKEIVEILFRDRYVKLLFATETFAMGVNMPARTVVFDSIYKFDGTNKRTLFPAEYIQMAGRAGRRGEDKTGTVVIMCKKQLPKIEDLQRMMKGKPEQLTSQFRLTYSMILRLLHVEKISVEDMMMRSYMEFPSEMRRVEYIKKIIENKERIKKMEENAGKSGNATRLTELYKDLSKYLSTFKKVRGIIFGCPKVQKDLLVLGRVVLITYQNHINKLGVILKIAYVRHQFKYHVIVLCNDKSVVENIGDGPIHLSLKSEEKNERKLKPDTWYQMLGLLSSDKIFVPDGRMGHTVFVIENQNIIDIYNKVVKVNVELVLNDWQERQIPRFRNKEPETSCSQVIQELTYMSLKYSELTSIIPTRVKVPPFDIAGDLEYLEELKGNFKSFKVADYPNFEEEFGAVFEIEELQTQIGELEFKNSSASMRLYPEYESKVKVLQNLKHIGKNNAVDVKGRVAIKMRNHELIITELVFGNILTKLRPQEIAALLSALVYQQSNKNKEPTEHHDIPEALREGIKAVQEVEDKIRREEMFCEVQTAANQNLNFDLVPVVYEWARKKPFSEIMKLTDVQEGIIVRCIQQLLETLRDVKDAANIIGDSVLSTKMDEARFIIKRDIVFTESLYIIDNK